MPLNYHSRDDHTFANIIHLKIHMLQSCFNILGNSEESLNNPWNIITHSCILFKPTASPRPKEVAKCISTVKTTNCTSNKLDSLNQGSLLYGATWRIHLLHLGCTNRQHNWKRFDQDRHKMSQMSTYTLKSVDYWMLWLVQMRFLTPVGQTLLSRLSKMGLKVPFLR